MKNLLKRVFYLCLSYVFFSILLFSLFKPVFTAKSVVFPYALTAFDICKLYPDTWLLIKKLYFIIFFFSYCIIFNNIYNSFIKIKQFRKKSSDSQLNNDDLNLLIGYSDKLPIQICEKGLYQNILITGTIGTGKPLLPCTLLQNK